MKWFCPWGPEIIDESLRPPITCFPEYIQRKYTTQILSREESPDHDKTLELLGHPSQHWDRVILQVYEPEYLEFLHLHPSEELWLEFEEIYLELEDMENIAKCSNLRVLSMGLNSTSREGMRALHRLPNLRQLRYDETSDPLPAIKALMEQPHLNMMEIYQQYDACNINTYPFRPRELQKALAYIRDQQHTARHLRLSIARGAVILSALSLCTNLNSICIHEDILEPENDLHLFLQGPALHKTVRYMRIWSSGIDSEAASDLAKFRNLLWLDLRCSINSVGKIVPVIMANANHLQSLRVRFFNNIGEAILDAISQCKSLQYVHLHDTGETREAVDTYREAKRPNWEALHYEWAEPRRTPSHEEYTDWYTDAEEEIYEESYGDSDAQ